MKISSASKKVLASALSAAMVVAFAPTVAFGASEGGKVTVSYDAGAGTAISGGQSGVASSKTYTIGKNQADALPLESGSDLMIKSGTLDDGTADGYAFDSWDVWADLDGDGTRAADNSEDITVSNNTANVSSGKIDSATKIYATAKYAAPSIMQRSTTTGSTSTAVDYVQFATVNGVDKVELSAAIDTSKGQAKNGAKFVVTAPGETAVEKTALNETAFDAKVGAWKVELKDGNGVTLDTKTFYIGSLTLTGAAFGDPASGQMTTSKTIWYQAGTSKQTYDSIIGSTTGYKIKDGQLAKDDSGNYITASNWYDADGSDKTVAGIGKKDKGAVNTTLTAYFGDVTLATFKNDKGTLTAVAAGVTAANAATTADQVNKYETTEFTGAKYYLAITDAAGKVVAESVDADGDNTNNGTWTASTGTLTASVEPGTYTATLYKLTGKTAASGIVDATPGKIETVGTKTVTVDAYKAAAPTWSFEAKYKADGTYDGGVLTLANAAGEGYTVQYKTTGDFTDYNTTLGGITVAASNTADFTIQSNNKKTGDDNVTSKQVVLVNFNSALTAFNNKVNALNIKTVNGKIGSYYVNNADVKAAIKAAKKSFTDKGFIEQAKVASNTWNDVTVAAEQSVVDAIAGVAKAELAKYAAGVSSADGKTVSVLSAADYADAAAAVDKVSAAYKANHDGVDGNNVKKVNDVVLGDNLTSYTDAVDAALQAGVKKAESYKAEDVAAAKTVTDSLKAAKTGAEAKAAVEAYNKLTDTQKKLVAASDVAAAQEIVSKAALVDSQDLAAARDLNGKKVTAKAKVGKKAQGKSFTYKLAASESGATASYAKVSGSKYIKISSTGKVTFSKVKVQKKAKTYKAKVSVTYGTQTVTKTVQLVVKKK